jgi:hypothetical protein
MKQEMNIFIGVIISGMLLTASCKKSVPQPTSSLVKSESSIITSSGITDTSTTTFTYNSNNQVVTQINITTPPGTIDSTTYSYASGELIVYTSASHNTVTYSLNNFGFAVSDNLGDSWTYNNPGYLISDTLLSSHTTTTYNYNTSYQLVSAVTIAPGDTTTTTYTYGSQSVPTSNNWQTGQNIGSLWTTQVTTGSNSGLSTTLKATYVLSGYNITMSTITGPGYSDITTFNY